ANILSLQECLVGQADALRQLVECLLDLLIDLTTEELDQRLALNGILSQNLRTQQLNRTLERSLINNLMLELA
ncbi:hypothetical protein QQ73_09925, partial [Candidatus Endoriftia persephone str. Guaymas]|nr:hypothetical protein [Candidatus Endoriftia persephone str. Guaymas]